MNQQITLSFENNTYYVKVNQNVLKQFNEVEEAYTYFKSVIQNNKKDNSMQWEILEQKVAALNVEGLQINSEYKNMTLGNVKYFYHSGKVFYIGQGKMTALAGDFTFFYRMLELVQSGYLVEVEAFASLCSELEEKGISYSLMDDCLSVSYGGFSYGTVAYRFEKGKMDKGTSSEKADFMTFYQLVKEAIK